MVRVALGTMFLRFVMLFRQIHHEFNRRAISAKAARGLREGRLASQVCIKLDGDAMSDYPAVTVTHIKTPTEQWDYIVCYDKTLVIWSPLGMKIWAPRARPTF